MKVKFIGRDGQPMSADDWKAKKDDPAYAIVEQYDNAVVRLTLKWSGRVNNPSNTFPEYWPVYVLLVQNYRDDGSLVNDPVDNDKNFPSEETAVEGYRQFLLKWTKCTADEAGEFTEVDNDLTPPPPPDPNKPSQEPDDPALGGVGAW